MECKDHADHANRIQSLDDWRIRHEEQNAKAREDLYGEINKTREVFTAKLDEITKVWAERVPIWVTVAFSLGSALITGLIMKVVGK